ncbi:TetR/AcrR family transcriptional regulator [Mycolicibacterium sp.]|uniref:TetR/AcrR family transcriptional regulator n=1 Tax=Mycolicibacterium sp. TaxID=2320850 RepID=UPI003D151CAA
MCSDADNATRQRILAATAEVLGRTGTAKLSLSDVAAQAGVSRPPLYRDFGRKRELLDVFAAWERRYYERAIAEATANLPAHQRLDAALQAIVANQLTYPGLRMVDIEPAQVITRMARVLPLIRERLERLCAGPDAAVAAATAVRVAIAQYLVRSDDSDQFLAQLRHAARVKTRVALSDTRRSAGTRGQIADR